MMAWRADARRHFPGDLVMHLWFGTKDSVDPTDQSQTVGSSVNDLLADLAELDPDPLKPPIPQSSRLAGMLPTINLSILFNRQHTTTIFQNRGSITADISQSACAFTPTYNSNLRTSLQLSLFPTTLIQDNVYQQ